MTLLRSAALAATLWLAASTARSAVLLIDPMTVEFPPNACFPVTQPRVIAWGEYCDAASCPPGTPVLADPSCASVEQPGFALALGSTLRFSNVGGGNGPLRARVVPGAQRMELVTGGGEYSALYVAYGDHGSGSWSVDLGALGMQSIEVVVDGEVSPAQPLDLEVMLGSPNGQDAYHLSNSHLQIGAPGTYAFALASFAPWPPGTSQGAVLEDVTLIDFLLSDCYEASCSGTSFPARAYSLGPLNLITNGPTPTRRTTWAKVKQHYR